MISLLVVAQPSAELSGLVARRPSVEILTAHGLEEAVEKLARNRRIDAVLLLSEREAPAIVAAIREENPAPPPLFVPAGERPAPPGTISLPASSREELLDLLSAELKS